MSLLITLEKKRSTARSLFFFKLFCSDQIHTCINRKVVYERIEEEKIFFYLCTCICYVRTRICQTRKLHIDREREKNVCLNWRFSICSSTSGSGRGMTR